MEEIFNKISFPIIIWKIDNDNILLDFDNGKIDGLKKNISIDDYLKQFEDKNIKKFKLFLINKNKMEIETCNINIILEFIDDNRFYELQYPKCSTEYILSSISYKIRNPLTNIVGILPLIESYNQHDQEFQKYVNIIKRSSVNIISLANDIIDILNIKQNKIIIQKEKINVEELIKICLKIVSNNAQKKKLNLAFKIDDDVPKYIYSDEGKLKQIIVNLLENGVKYTPIGGISIMVSLSKNDDTELFPYRNEIAPKYNILFKIKDTGIGINDGKKDILNAILGINDKISMKTYKLTGFGIYIARNLCNLLGGNVWFKSEKDIGTIFYFNIICETNF